jgi:hypothetical protein
MVTDPTADAAPGEWPPDELLVQRARAHDTMAFDELDCRHRACLALRKAIHRSPAAACDVGC